MRSDTGLTDMSDGTGARDLKAIVDRSCSGGATVARLKKISTQLLCRNSPQHALKALWRHHPSQTPNVECIPACGCLSQVRPLTEEERKTIEALAVQHRTSCVDVRVKIGAGAIVAGRCAIEYAKACQ